MYDVCPLCGGKIKKGKCRECGYKPPEESDIAAPYDIDPNNDRFGSTEDKFIPFEELYPYAKQEERQDNVPNIKVRPQKNPPAKQKQYTPPKKKNTPKKAKKKKSKSKDIIFDTKFIIILGVVFVSSIFFEAGLSLILPLIFITSDKKKKTDSIRILLLITAFFFGMMIKEITHNI